MIAFSKLLAGAVVPAMLLIGDTMDTVDGLKLTKMDAGRAFGAAGAGAGTSQASNVAANDDVGSEASDSEDDEPATKAKPTMRMLKGKLVEWKPQSNGGGISDEQIKKSGMQLQTGEAFDRGVVLEDFEFHARQRSMLERDFEFHARQVVNEIMPEVSDEMFDDPQVRLDELIEDRVGKYMQGRYLGWYSSAVELEIMNDLTKEMVSVEQYQKNQEEDRLEKERHQKEFEEDPLGTVPGLKAMLQRIGTHKNVTVEDIRQMIDVEVVNFGKSSMRYVLKRRSGEAQGDAEAPEKLLVIQNTSSNKKYEEVLAATARDVEVAFEVAKESIPIEVMTPKLLSELLTTPEGDARMMRYLMRTNAPEGVEARQPVFTKDMEVLKPAGDETDWDSEETDWDSDSVRVPRGTNRTRRRGIDAFTTPVRKRPSSSTPPTRKEGFTTPETKRPTSTRTDGFTTPDNKRPKIDPRDISPPRLAPRKTAKSALAEMQDA